ncbi:hypothetical protein ACSNOH_25650 [Streptomyces sp. URMC 127]|uniref:hypothetical protein n=1 Tax=Streptomyces sp. URMC 127 TaxID=3423402 RepID=UPI003F1E1182
MITEDRTAAARRRTGVSPAPKWARVAARLTVASTVPSGLWRIALAVGVPLGVGEEELREGYHSPGWGTVYMIGLSVLAEALALLTVGLVRPWGEVVPRWVPVLGGKAVRPAAAVVPAAVGAGLVTLLWWSQLIVLLFIPHDHPAPYGGYRALMLACYLPLLLWGPLLAAVTVSYHRRHRALRRP